MGGEKEQSTTLREFLEDSPRTKKREEIMNMSLEDMTKELAESGQKPKQDNESHISVRSYWWR